SPVWTIGNDAQSNHDSAESDSNLDIHEELSWPVPGTAGVSYFLQGSANGLGQMTLTAPSGACILGTYLDTGTVTESEVLNWLAAQRQLTDSGQSATPSGDFLWFETDPLPDGLRIAGQAFLKLFSASSTTSTHFTPVLFDIGPLDSE